MFYLAPIPKQFVDSSGVPYSDGTVEVFLHNDTRRGEIYLDAEGTALAPNPAKLDSHGAWIGYVPADVEYDYIIKDKNGNVVFSFSNVVAVGGGKASSEVDNRLWGHWQNESSWTQTPEVDAWYQTGNFLKAEGDLGGSPGPLWVPITLPAGLYNYSLEIAFLGDSSGGYEKFDLKISYGGQSLRAMSFTFNNSYGSGVLSTEWASGDFALQSDGELKFEVAHKNLNGSSNPSVKISHVFLHKVTAKGSGGGSGGGDQFVLVRSNMTTNFTNAEYQDCVDAVTEGKAVCVQFERNSRTFQAQLTQVEHETGLLVFEIDVANIHITYEVSGTNNSHTIAESDYQNGTPIFDTLQTAILWNVVLHNGDIFETNGFHASDDGGAARYKVTSSGTANGKDIIELSSGKLAVLQVNDDGSLYPEQLGYIKDLPYADRVDCTPYFNRIWTKCTTIRLHNGRYWFNDYVNLPKGAKIIGENIYTDTPTEMATYRSGDYFVYCENRENVIKNIVFSNRSNNGNLSPVNTGGVGIRTNEWLHSGAAHFDYDFRHLRMMGFRKGMELQGSTKWAVTLYDIRFSQCWIGLEFGEASFNIDCHKIYTDHCSEAGINFHGEGVFGFYDCNIGSIKTGVKVSEYSGSQYHDILLSFFNTNFECDDQTVTNIPGLYFDIDDALDVILNFDGCRFMQNAGVYTPTNRCIALGKNTLVNIKGCEVRNNSGTSQSSDNFWNENRPCKFVIGAIRISDNCRGLPVPQFIDEKYNLCSIVTDTDILEIVSSSGGGIPGNNLYDKSNLVTLQGYVSEPNSDHPNGFFTLNNSTQYTLVIPITGYMQGQTIRLSSGTDTHNRWKIAKNATLPGSGVTDVTWISSTATAGTGRDYTDFAIGANETGYILIFFTNGGSSAISNFANSVMVCVSPYYTPYEEYQGGGTTYRKRVKPSLIDGTNKVGRIFQSLSEAIQEESILFVGDIFETNGFHSSGDGGAARYLVSDTGTANGMDIIQLASGKFATIQITQECSPEQIGYVAGTDAVPYVKRLITIGIKRIRLIKSYTWKTTLTLTTRAIDFVGNSPFTQNPVTSLINVNLNTGLTSAIVLRAPNITFENLYFYNAKGTPSDETAVYCDWTSNANNYMIKFKRVRFVSFNCGVDFHGTLPWHITFEDIVLGWCNYGIVFAANSSILSFKNIHTNGCYVCGINMRGATQGVTFTQCNFGSYANALHFEKYGQHLNQEYTFNGCNFELDKLDLDGNTKNVFIDVDNDINVSLDFSGCNFVITKENLQIVPANMRFIRLGNGSTLRMTACIIEDDLSGGAYLKQLIDESRIPLQETGSLSIDSTTRFFEVNNALIPYVMRTGQAKGLVADGARTGSEVAISDCNTWIPDYDGQVKVARVSTYEGTQNMPVASSFYGFLWTMGVIHNPNIRVWQMLLGSNGNIYTRLGMDLGSGMTWGTWKTITAT